MHHNIHYRPTCTYCDIDEYLRYDHNEGILVCTKCGLVIETQYMNDTMYQIDQCESFLDHECYDYYPLIGIENDLPLVFIKDAYEKASEVIHKSNYKGVTKLYIHAASVFLICKQNNKDKTYEDICNQYKISFVKLSKGIKICLESGVFTDDCDIITSDNEEVIMFNKCMSLFPIHDMNIKIYVRKTFGTILRSTKDNIMIGKPVKTIVCCILCYIFEKSEFHEKIPYNKDDISKSLSITKVTLNKVMKQICNSL